MDVTFEPNLLSLEGQHRPVDQQIAEMIADQNRFGFVWAHVRPRTQAKNLNQARR